VELELSGIATGYILDQVFNQLHTRLPDATGIKLDIGGDTLYWGHPPLSDGWRVGIANPTTTNESDLLVTLTTHNGRAITESGHANRFRTIGGKQYSHIFNPATGWPVENSIGSVTVAKTAVASDAAATAMTVMPSVEEAAAWASAIADLDGLAIDSAGHQAVSNDWATFIAEEIVEDNNAVLALNYTLPTFASQTAYARPYVAIWITDSKKALRKNLLLLGKDQRWARENTRWWRQVGRTHPDLLDGTARPTRAPGEYRLTWDGRDEDGMPLPAGDYTLHIEAARQDGGHNYQTLPFTLGTAKTLELAGEGEIGKLVLEIE
jgi:thiamine biosynthesis lipoprotein